MLDWRDTPATPHMRIGQTKSMPGWWKCSFWIANTGSMTVRVYRIVCLVMLYSGHITTPCSWLARASWQIMYVLFFILGYLPGLLNHTRLSLQIGLQPQNNSWTSRYRLSSPQTASSTNQLARISRHATQISYLSRAISPHTWAT